MKVLLFGTTGGIGNSVAQAFIEAECEVIEVNRKTVDFTSPASDKIIQDLIKLNQPDVIVNCAGYLAYNDETAGTTLKVNVESNWSIIRYYIDNVPKKPVKIILVGSSAYREGKKQYMVYSASKAALHNLWEGARDYFEGTPLTVHIIHPVRTRTAMTIDRFSPDLDYFEPEEVAEEILSLADEPVSKCVKLSFQEKK